MLQCYFLFANFEINSRALSLRQPEIRLSSGILAQKIIVYCKHYVIAAPASCKRTQITENLHLSDLMMTDENLANLLEKLLLKNLFSYQFPEKIRKLLISL